MSLEHEIRSFAKTLGRQSKDSGVILSQGVVQSVEGDTCTLASQGEDQATSGWPYLLDAYSPVPGDVVWVMDAGPASQFIVGPTKRLLNSYLTPAEPVAPITTVHSEPQDDDLLAIAALHTLPYGRSLLTLADAAALRASADVYSTAQVDTALATKVDKVGIYASASTDIILSRVLGDTVDRFELEANGTTRYGPGNAAVDTSLSRSDVGTLRTGGKHEATGNVVSRVTATAQASIGNLGPAAEAALALGLTSDVVIYRSAADVARTPDSFRVDGAIQGGAGGLDLSTATTVSPLVGGTGIGDKIALYSHTSQSGAYGIGVASGKVVAYLGSGGTSFSVRMTAASAPYSAGAVLVDLGKVGPGSLEGVALGSTGDVKIYRSSANNLRTPNNLTVDGTTHSVGAMTTAAGGAAGVGTQSVASALYVQSRLENLITNGSGLLGNNYNFSGFTFDASQVFAGAGSFLLNANHQSRVNDELIPVDPSRYYELALWARSGEDGGTNFNAANRQYFGIATYDIDGNLITPQFFMKWAGSAQTTLAAPLNPGDTTVTLTSAAGWYNAGTASAKYLGWWPYVNSKGYSYPTYSYTRNISVADAWAAGGIVGNVITLRAPWAGPALAAGTPIANMQSGGTYRYIAGANIIVPNSWTKYTGFIGTVSDSGSTNTFPPGTAYVRFVHLNNYHDIADNNLRISGITLNESPVRNMSVPIGWSADGVAAPDSTIQRTAAGRLQMNGQWEAVGDLVARVGSAQQVAIGARGAGSAAGFTFGSTADVNLYRSNVDILSTDDQFRAGGAIRARTGLSSEVIIGNVGPSGEAAILLGSAGDSVIYRSAADQLRTPDGLTVDGAFSTSIISTTGVISSVIPTATSVAYQVRVTGDANSRYRFRNTGLMEWGDGTAAVDTNLYRISADALRTDDTFMAGLNMIARHGGASSQVIIGDVGPGSLAGIALGSALDAILYRPSADVLRTPDSLVVDGTITEGATLLSSKYAPKADAWTNATLEAGWTNYGAPYQVARYRKNGDKVELEGLIVGPAAGTALILPVGYRPASLQMMASVDAAGVAHITVYNTGEVTCLGGGLSTFVSLSNLSFSTS